MILNVILWDVNHKICIKNIIYNDLVGFIFKKMQVQPQPPRIQLAHQWRTILFHILLYWVLETWILIVQVHWTWTFLDLTLHLKLVGSLGSQMPLLSQKYYSCFLVLLISQWHCFQYQLFKTKQSKISQVMPEKNSLMEHYPVYKATLIFFLKV